jgi:hypothetical protein
MLTRALHWSLSLAKSTESIPPHPVSPTLETKNVNTILVGKPLRGPALPDNSHYQCIYGTVHFQFCHQALLHLLCECTCTDNTPIDSEINKDQKLARWQQWLGSLPAGHYA